MLGWVDLNGFGQLLSPPKFADKERTRAAWWLNAFLLSAIGVLVVLIVFPSFSPVIPGSNRLGLAFQFTLIVLCGGIWAAMRMGFVRTAAFVFLASLYLATVLPLLFVVHTIRDVVVIGFLMLVSATGLVCGRKALWSVVALTVLTLCAVYWLEVHGYFLVYAPIQARPGDLLLILIGLAVSTALSLASLRDTQESANNAQRIAATLVMTHRELVASQTLLFQARDQLERRKDYEETLRLAKENAEAATRAKSEFLSNISHEIRTPINGIVGMMSLLQASELSEEQRTYVNTIRHSSDMLLTIVNDILDLSLAESGRLVIERQPFEVYRAVEEVLDLLAPQAAEKDLELVYNIERSVPATVMGDATRLRQVLINVVSNAIKFTPRGEISVSVDAKPVDDQRVQLHLAIRDTGIGIAPDRIQQLFQPFSQADASSTRRYGGAGLGLVISKRLCELMGGSIWVESEQHVGSTFHFTLVAPIVEATGTQAVYEVHPALKRRTVLVVDDNPAVRQILRQMMSEWGMVPMLAASGAEALALVRAQSLFDIVVIDMQMSGMSGLTLAKELRKLVVDLPIVMTSALGAPMYAAGDNRHLHDLPIVMSPAAGANEQREAVRQLGIKSIVFKPLKPSVVRAALLECFDTTTSDSSAVSPGAPRKSNENFDSDMGRRYPLHILLAEDNLTNQKVALRMLKRLGYGGDVAVNGLEAVKAVHEKSYDVILMDVQMPEMDGLEAARRIRMDLAAPDQPYIIAMTAAALPEDREKCIEAGMNDFVAKPARLEDLAQALKRFLPLSTSAC